jgi:tetratricopeptide (TPR) repeat protein
MLPPNYLELYDQALRYDRAGDPYTAVKLLKKVIRTVPDWPDAYRRLGTIYSRRHEWKPALHYWSKTVALDADDREAWWQLGLAAVPLKRMRTAQTVWAKFGYDKLRYDKPLGLQLKHGDGFEILWMQPLDAARGRVVSIPHPGGGLRYRDIMVYDRRGQRGNHVVNRRRVPIYQSVTRLKRSPYQTFSCLLHTGSEEAVRRLERLCFDAGLGFEVWSNATRTLRANVARATEDERRAFPEYYGDLLPRPETGTTLVALAALHPAEVERVLNDWQIITLRQFSDLRSYG